MSNRLAWAWLPMALCCLVGGFSTGIAQSPSVPRVQTVATTSDSNYVALMGQISRPGVYECPLPADLTDLLKRTGGLTSEATGNLRLVRQGRSGQQMFFSPGLQFQLLPGDVLVAEGKPNMSGMAGTVSGLQNRGVGANSSRRSGSVQLGLVQLLDWPVVVEVSADRATVRDVWSLLNQPPSSTATISVLKPGAGQQNVAVNQSPSIALTSGTVLVLDRRSIVAATLPALPQPARLPEEVNAALKPAVIPEPVSAPVVEQPPTASNVVTPPEHSPPVTMPMPEVQSSVPVTSETLSPAIPERVADVPPPRAPASAIAMHELPPAPTSASPTHSSVLASNPLAVPEAVDVPPSRAKFESIALRSQTKSPAEVSRGTPTSSAAIILLGVVGAFLVTLRVLQHYERRNLTQTESRPRAGEQPLRVLDALIENSLPVVEEPIILPRSVHLYGRTLDTGRHRLDTPQAIQPPHFSPRVERVPQPSEQPSEVNRLQPKSVHVESHTTPAPHINTVSRGDVSEHQSGSRLLDRVLLSVHGGKR